MKLSKCDLSELYSIADGDNDFIREVLEVFTEKTPEMLANLRKSIETKQLAEVGSIAHKISGSIVYIGIPEEKLADLQYIETKAKQNEFPDDMLLRFSDFNNACLAAIEEIRTLLNKGV